jgi:predicted component of type VI protein secretion system
MIAKLIVASGKSAGRSIAIKRNQLLIGRAEQCDVRPLSEDVSRRHCAVSVGPSEVWVEDLGSRNGTFVNGSKITERTKVVDGDVIRVGSLELRVSCTTQTAKGGSADDISRWLTADDQPAGMSDTTRSIPAVRDDATVAEKSEIHATVPTNQAAAESGTGDSFVSGIESPGQTDPGSASGRQSALVAIEALKAARSTPSSLPSVAKKPATDTSRDAAAEALRKFFENR